jgi:hypothetical protein
MEDELWGDPEYYFNDEKQIITCIIRGPGFDEWKEMYIESKEEYFKRKLEGK